MGSFFGLYVNGSADAATAQQLAAIISRRVNFVCIGLLEFEICGGTALNAIIDQWSSLHKGADLSKAPLHG